MAQIDCNVMMETIRCQSNSDERRRQQWFRRGTRIAPSNDGRLARMEWNGVAKTCQKCGDAWFNREDGREQRREALSPTFAKQVTRLKLTEFDLLMFNYWIDTLVEREWWHELIEMEWRRLRVDNWLEWKGDVAMAMVNGRWWCWWKQ